MRKLYTSAKLIAALSIGVGGNAFGFMPVKAKSKIFQRSGISTPEIGEKLHRVTTKQIPSSLADHVEVDAITNAIRLMEGNIKDAPIVSEISEEKLLEAVRSYTEKHSELGIDFDSLKLKRENLVLNKKFQFLKFDVYKNGQQIRDAQVDFRFRAGQLYQVVNQSYSEAAVSNIRLSSTESKELASFVSNSDVSLTQDSVWRVTRAQNGYQLVPVSKYSAKTPYGEFNIEVNLADGSIREITDKHFHATAVIKGFSRTYKENPLHVYYSEGVIFDSNGTREVSGENGEVGESNYLFNEITGKAATIRSKDEKVALRAAPAVATTYEEESGQYVVNPWKNASADDTWASYGTVYANISVIKDLINSTVGSSITPWMDEATEVYVNHNNHCNAYWDGSSINFFQASSKCANSGNLGEIVLHEWGHGLDHNTGGIDDGAYSEGFGDLLAFSVYWNPKIGEGFFKGSDQAVRDISVFKSYPKDKTGRVHSEGQIIGNTMFDLYNTLKQEMGAANAKAKFRSYLYTMIFQTKFYTDVHDYLMSFESDTATRCLVNGVFENHGLAKTRSECVN